MKEILHILSEDASVGTLGYDRKKDEISLFYEDEWRFGKSGFPMSLSLPLTKSSHADSPIRSFLKGLLPDNSAVLDAWGKRFQISPRNPFDVIKHVGEDCAGSLQFVRPERLERIRSGELDSLTPLTEAELALRMENLQAQTRAIPTAVDGRFSLAGAQTKDALHWENGNWFVPAGRIPSTHILKPQSGRFEEHALNEHFCLRLASAAGLRGAESRLIEIAGTKVLVVERYDRVRNPADGRVRRIHQEDTCQALGRFPREKYQADGGPSAAEILRLLDRFSDDPAEDVSRFIRALSFNWALAGTDAHSKNYSLLHGPASQLRLAPFYDLASFLPYETDAKSTKVKLAMKIGGTYRMHQVNAAKWGDLATEAGLGAGLVKLHVSTLVENIIASVEPVRAAAAETEDSPFLHRLAEAISVRAANCAAIMK